MWNSDDTRLLGMTSTTRGRPSLPPTHGSSLENKSARNEATSQILNELKPKPAARPFGLQRQSPVLEKTIVETLTHLDQEVTSQTPPQPHPRRRLASFGGVSSPGSLSPFTGLGAYNQNNNGNKSSGTGSDAHLIASLGSRGSTGSLKVSPQSSGRNTPIPGLAPMHLQHVRDQMVVALQRLKELEEQVKVVPILQVKISVLQEEKRHLLSQVKNQSDALEINDAVWKTAYSKDKSGVENKVNTDQRVGSSDCTDFREFRQLTEEMQALEENIKSRHLQELRGRDDSPLLDKSVKSVAVGSDTDTDVGLSTVENKYVNTDQVETRSIATEVCEVNLGICIEAEAELEVQRLTIGALKEKICHLEAELKESALQTEMSRLKLELHVAGARNRADKACLARPSTASTGVEVRPHTASQGVGNHTESRDASTGEATETKTVGVSCCGPELKNICTGPDLPMSRWEIRERVETLEKCVGIRVTTNTQGVGMEMRLRDAETNTEEPLESKREKIEYHSVACGDCSVDVIVCEAREVVSQGMATDRVRGINLGVMASPQTASQRTNTVSNSVSRFTNTTHAFNVDSSTNTLLSTQDKHTNTAQTITRTVSVGNRVRDISCTPETCTIAVGPATGTVTKRTRDTGVGLTNIYENFLVGLKTRNKASGPSHLPDPITTRSIGVGEGKIRDLSASLITPGQSFQPATQSQWDSELNHYIEEMQRLLGEHGDLLTDDYAEQYSGQRSGSSKLLCSNKAAARGGTDVHWSDSQPPVTREIQFPSRLSVDPLKRDKENPGICQVGGNESEVKRMIQALEQQASSSLQGRSMTSGMLRSVKKKQSKDPDCSSNRKSMKFMGVTTGLDPVSSYELSASEKNCEEGEKRGNRKVRDVSHDGAQARKSKSGNSNKGPKACAKPPSQQRCQLSDRILSACQALKKHSSDDAASSSRELHDCLETLEQEWFSVSSHKSAAPDVVGEHLSAFLLISPSVLQHVANMADSNGNTALHYSVSHSNFGVVKKLLDAEVCNVDHQNKAGYTPIMLAALAAVETPEDMRVVEQLFTKGDVNAKASQAGQTALMLAVSHGRMDMVQALLAQGAQVNLQDDEGSTALMCASEHGHADIVKLLLARPDCDATLTDSDESTALSIALEAGHNDIAVLLYAHANFSRGQTGAAARHSGKSVSSSGARNNPE